MSLLRVLVLGSGVLWFTLAVIAPWITLRRYANTKPSWIRFALAYECLAIFGIAVSIGELVPAEPVGIVANVIALPAIFAGLFLLFASGRSA
jgi:hypothetical protein